MLLPLFLIVYMNWIDRHSLGEECVMVGSSKIFHLLFADDLVLLDSSKSNLQHTLNRFATVCNDEYKHKEN